ncbi:GlxA family transcriptional regulator [Streptomyces sp. NPDC019531]|uniref:GlxA family transcriptional regulator n=1 Tax=Streptomyces sp. NPDC019531 TaxID=3365062 RepID=UPI00384CA115
MRTVGVSDVDVAGDCNAQGPAEGSVQLHSVLVFLYDGVQDLGFCGPVEVFSRANTGHELGFRYDVRTVSADGGTVRTSGGLRFVPDGSIADVAEIGTLVVSGVDGIPTAAAETIRGLGALAARAERVASVCTGAFLLAEAGLLDGRRVVTHWKFADDLARRFPALRVNTRDLVVTDGRFTTSAGAASGIDLALSLVEEDLGRDVAQGTARQLVTQLRKPGGQAPFTDLGSRDARNPALRQVQHRVLAEPAGDWSLQSLSRCSGLSVRHLTRLFRLEVGMSAREFVEYARVSVASRSLVESGKSLESIAEATGFGTEGTMRAAFLRVHRIPPGEYRSRFS